MNSGCCPPNSTPETNITVCQLKFKLKNRVYNDLETKNSEDLCYKETLDFINVTDDSNIVINIWKYSPYLSQRF